MIYNDKNIKGYFFSFSITLQVIILILVCGGGCFLLYKIVCKIKNEKVYIVIIYDQFCQKSSNSAMCVSFYFILN